MFFTGSFGKHVDILQRTMGAATLRGDVIANNIANSDTPGYKRSMVNFESELTRALRSENVKPFPTLMTDSRHIAFQRPKDYRDVKPNVVWDYLTTSKNNGNNVDIEQESMNRLQNQLLYQTLAQAVSTAFNQVNIVLR